MEQSGAGGGRIAQFNMARQGGPDFTHTGAGAHSPIEGSYGLDDSFRAAPDVRHPVGKTRYTPRVTTLAHSKRDGRGIGGGKRLQMRSMRAVQQLLRKVESRLDPERLSRQAFWYAAHRFVLRDRKIAARYISRSQIL